MTCKALQKILSQPVDIAILVYFRLVFGGVMVWEMARYMALGRVSYLWADPEFHFKYYGFGWVEALGGNGMFVVCWGMLIAAVGVTVGLAYRFCAMLFAIGICYLFLIEQAKFMNHFYLMCLLAWVAVFLPLNRSFSLDAMLRPKLRSDAAPGWTLWLLRFQMGVVYFYGGIAKLNPDWLRGNPMRQWLAERSDFPLLGSFFQSSAAPYFFSYGGLLFDLLIVPALLWKRTRLIAFAFAAFFHFANSQLFTIGVFPVLALGLTALFFDPSWPRNLLNRFRKNRERSMNSVEPPMFALRRITIAVLGVYVVLQLIIPFRHFLYPGYVSWTEEGHRFSWHMMLRSKRVPAGTFFVVDPESKQRWVLDPSVYLTNRQYKKMLGNPDMLQQFAAHIGNLMREQGFPNAQVKAAIYCRLNGRPPALLIDPNIDLASVKRNLLPADWILPLGSRPPPGNSNSLEIGIDDDGGRPSPPFDPSTEPDLEP